LLDAGLQRRRIGLVEAADVLESYQSRASASLSRDPGRRRAPSPSSDTARASTRSSARDRLEGLRDRRQAIEPARPGRPRRAGRRDERHEPTRAASSRRARASAVDHGGTHPKAPLSGQRARHGSASPAGRRYWTSTYAGAPFVGVAGDRATSGCASAAPRPRAPDRLDVGSNGDDQVGVPVEQVGVHPARTILSRATRTL